MSVGGGGGGIAGAAIGGGPPIIPPAYEIWAEYAFIPENIEFCEEMLWLIQDDGNTTA
jgi:hypothetical protein